MRNLALALAIQAAIGLQADVNNDGSSAMAGFVYFTYSAGSYSTNQSTRSLQSLAAAGVNWLEIGSTWYVTTINSTNIYPDPQRSPTDADVRRAISDARAAGVRYISLKPHVDSMDGIWRGEIGGKHFNDSQWADWWSNYTAYITHMAQIAADEQVDGFNVGTELDCTVFREADWRAVIASVRAILPASTKMWYGANWGSPSCNTTAPYITIQWWDALDLIGIDAYYPVSDHADPTLAEVQAFWAKLAPNMSALSAKWNNKQIIFAEIGYASFKEAATDAPACCTGLPDLATQATLYQGLLSSYFNLQPWFGGQFWWAWDVSDVDNYACSTDFSIHNKPAYSVLQQYYGGSSGSQLEAAAAAVRAADAATTAAAAAPTPIVLYTNGVRNASFDDWSWGCAVQYADSGNPYPGHADSATAALNTSQAGNVVWRTATPLLHLTSAGYTALTFDVLAANVNDSINIGATLCACDNCNSCGTALPSIPAVDYLASGPNPACTLPQSWPSPATAAHVRIPLSALFGPDADPDATPVSRVHVGWVAGSGTPHTSTIHFDNVQLE